MEAPHARIALKQGREALALLAGLDRPVPVPSDEGQPVDLVEGAVLLIVFLSVLYIAYIVAIVTLGLVGELPE